jgi:hypothetical protein
MSLIGETIQDVKVQEKLTDTDLEGRIEPLLEGLEGTINGATYTFQKTPFNYIESGEHVNIAVSTAQSSSGTVLGRELSITVSDDNVSNSVAIMQIGDENGPLMITKRVNPVYDAEIMEMTQFFTSHNTFDDYKVIMSVFASGLRGDEVQGVADLVEKYADPSDKATIASFVDHMKTRAENHRISQQMKASFVGMDLPSAAELQDIADLMVSVRNI